MESRIPQPTKRSRLTLDAEMAELPRLSAWLDGLCGVWAVPPGWAWQLHVIAEEVVVNVIQHGHCMPVREAIEVEVGLEGSEMEVTVADSGIPFNPLDAPVPDLGAGLAERKVGGLGVHLVRGLMDEVEYERSEGHNHLRLRKRFEGASEEDQPV
jgi:anti-sigma regulatory factor (Ser/Thr protein kinase)